MHDIKELFDFIVTEDQTRFADVWKMQPLSEYGAIIGEPSEESETLSVEAAAEPNKESETVSMILAVEPREESAIISISAEKPREESK